MDFRELLANFRFDEVESVRLRMRGLCGGLMGLCHRCIFDCVLWLHILVVDIVGTLAGWKTEREGYRDNAVFVQR